MNSFGGVPAQFPRLGLALPGWSPATFRRSVRTVILDGMGKLTLALLCLSPLVVPAKASVQEPKRTEDDPEARPSQKERDSELPTLNVTITVSARSPSSTPQVVTVIDRDTIDDSGARTVGEVLSYAPALFVLPSGSRGGSTIAQIRGGDPNFTLVLLDGVPLNDSTDPLGGVVNLESLPLNGIERIEIARGPMSFYHGSAALAGVINLVTKRGEPNEAEARAEIEVGNASSFRTAGSYSDGFTGGDYFVAVQWEEEAGRVAEDRFEQLHLLGNLRLKLGERAGLQLGTRVTSWESDDYLPWCITLDNSKGISRLRFWAKNRRVNGINDLPVFMHQGSVVVVRSTRVPSGMVGRNGEVNDDEVGTVASGDLNAPKARVLLKLALLKTQDPVAIQSYFDRY